MESDTPLILGFDTTAAHCAAVLLSGAQVLASRREEMARGQAERLVPLLSELLDEAGHKVEDLTAIGVGVGPGNFTGARLAVATARGLSMALQIPAVGVSAFDALAYGQAGPVLVACDGRAGRLYIQGFGTGPEEPCLIAETDLASLSLASGLPCLGDKAALIAEVTGGREVEPNFPVAEAIARIAATRFQMRDLPRPAPLYLRGAAAAPPRDAPPELLP